MAIFNARGCCASCEFNCTDWCSCLPEAATISIELKQKWQEFIDGSVKDWGECSLKLNNIKMVKYADAMTCILYAEGGTGKGTWSYDEYQEFHTQPMNSYYITPNCPGSCNTWNLAQTINRSGGGAIDANELYLECYDPCNQPYYAPTFPTNRLNIDIIGNITNDIECYGEYLTNVCGSNIPPYTTTENLVAKIYGKPECLKTSTFINRTLEWFNLYDGVYPHINSTLCNPANICDGGCKGMYDCLDINDGSHPYKPFYNWWSSYDAYTCKETICFDTHSCWNGYYGNQPAVYSCVCSYPPYSGEATRYYKSHMQSNVYVSIP